MSMMVANRKFVDVASTLGVKNGAQLEKDVNVAAKSADAGLKASAQDVVDKATAGQIEYAARSVNDKANKQMSEVARPSFIAATINPRNVPFKTGLIGGLAVGGGVGIAVAAGWISATAAVVGPILLGAVGLILLGFLVGMAFAPATADKVVAEKFNELEKPDTDAINKKKAAFAGLANQFNAAYKKFINAPVPLHGVSPTPPR